MTDIGMNLSAVNYWGSEEPFIDRFKTSGTWYAVNDQYQRLATAVPLDAYGYPSGMPAGAKEMSTQIGVDPLGSSGCDTYVITYSGTASMRMTGGTIISSSAGQVVFKLTDPVNNFVTLTVTADSASNPLTGIHVVRQDQETLFKAGGIFNPDFLAKASNWDTLRFMDWEATNTLQPVTWANRTTVQSASWSQSSNSGVPLEIMVSLANATHTAMWFNIPTEADDSYVKNALTYIRDNLDPSLKVNVEYSNEMWNWSDAASHWGQTQANALWGKDANGNGVIDPKDPKEYVAGGEEVYYGYRSAQIAVISNAVFAATPNRVANVISTQTAYTGLETKIFSGIALANVGSVSSLFDSYAITTYFGDALSAASSVADQQMVLGWARGGAAGMTAAFNELVNGGSLNTDDSLAALMKTMVYQEGVAEKYGLTLVAYEGGASLSASAFPTSVQGEVSSFISRLMNDPRMGALYTQMVNEFSVAGGAELNAYSDSNPNKIGGYWGVLDTIYQTSSPRYDALVAAAKAADAVAQLPPSPTVIAGPNVKTSLANYTLDGTLQTLAYSGSGYFTGTGNALANTLMAGNGGSAGNDTLVGGSGVDVLDGGTGADTMRGGAGDDIYYVDNIGDVVTELTGQGADLVHTTLASYTLTSNVESLTFDGTGAFLGIGNASDNVITGGISANNLNGGAGNDRLIGGAGNDKLDGGTGIDTMFGGAGDDTYYIDNKLDKVVELAGGGTDLVYASATYTLPDQVENLTLTGSMLMSGIGNALDNQIKGNISDNILSGMAGNDTIQGGDGNDTISGGDGNDYILGQSGNDTLIGGAGNDMLDGGAGADLMKGGTGNDTYFVDNVGDIVTELSGEGTDSVSASINYTLGTNVEKLSLAGAATVAIGNALDNVIQNSNASGASTLYGMDGNDTLIGGSGADVLYVGNGNDVLSGGAGDDWLFGGAGIDAMAGGAGADRFIFLLANDTGSNRTTADTIRDFSHADGDKIDLSAIKTTSGQALHYVGTAAFTKTAGEVRVVNTSGSNWDVQVDINGDGVTDMYVATTAAAGMLVNSDFSFTPDSLGLGVAHTSTDSAAASLSLASINASRTSFTNAMFA